MNFSLRFPLLEQQDRIQSSRKRDRVWHSGDQVTNLLEHIILQDLFRYEDRPSAQVLCHQYRSRLSVLTDRRSQIGRKASSRIYCNREGLNLYLVKSFWEFRAPKARIGFVTNNANNCDDVNTKIGFGTGGPHVWNRCRQKRFWFWRKFMKAMGYILVQWRAKAVLT